MLRKTCALLLFACLLAVFPVFVQAQTVNGIITGTVTDPSGAVVVGARITITNTGTGISQSTTTGALGEYRFPVVPPGNYTIQIEATGFGIEKANGV